MKLTKIVAAAGTLALAGGLAGAAQTAQARVHPVPEGSAVVHVTGPVQGGGGVWASARYTAFEQLYLVDSHVVTVGSVSPLVVGETVYTYSLRVRDNGRFRAIPWALTPNQSFGPRHIRGAANGDLSGFADYRLVIDLSGTTKAPVVVDPAIATPQKIIDAALATPAVAFSTTYTASGIVWTHVHGYWRTLVPGHWQHFKAVKGHKAYSRWIPAKRVHVPARWVSHHVTQQWTNASYNNHGQSFRAGNITGFFSHR